MDPRVLSFVAHMLSAHIAVPEPVFVQWAPVLTGFDCCFEYARDADVTMYPGRWVVTENGATKEPDYWVIRIYGERWDRLRQFEKDWLIAHEICHAVYPTSHWDARTDEERKAIHKTVDACASKAIRSHLLGINHKEWE